MYFKEEPTALADGGVRQKEGSKMTPARGRAKRRMAVPFMELGTAEKEPFGVERQSLM